MRKIFKKLSELNISRRAVLSVISLMLCALIGIAANLSMLAGLDFSQKITDGTFTYKGDDLSVTAEVSGTVPGDSQLTVTRADSSSHEYTELSKKVAMTADAKPMLAVNLAFTGESGEKLENTVANKAKITVSGEAVDSCYNTYQSLVKQLEDTDSDAVIKAYQLQSDGDIDELGLVESEQRDLDASYTIGGEAEGTIMFAAEPQLSATAADENVNFTVQYYARINNISLTTVEDPHNANYPKYATKSSSGSTELYLESMNTHTDSGAVLPKNGQDNNRVWTALELVSDSSVQPANGSTAKDGNMYKLKLDTDETPYQLFLDHSFNTANYKDTGSVNILANSTSYTPTAIRVYASKDDTNPTTYDIDSSDPDSVNDYTITTESDGTEKNIVVSEGSVIRFVYGETDISDESTSDVDCTFYDYNISDGNVYSDADLSSLVTKSEWDNLTTDSYLSTYRKGINNDINYEIQYQTTVDNNGTDDTDDDVINKKQITEALLGFGNANMGTGLGSDAITYTDENNNEQSLLINASNDQSGNNEYNFYNSGAAFGLVTGIDSEGNLKFKNSIAAPNLFGTTSAKGKNIYNNGQLHFRQKGDTYILSSSSIGDEQRDYNLEYFFIPENGVTSTGNVTFTNNFWPMDKSSEDYETNDPQIGVVDTHRMFSGDTTGAVPSSDDTLDHNAFYGMKYELDFQLADDYTGPLNYYFFGDDDMWVFLDGQLVCDIGGIHSALGQYVDLWDYLDKPDTNSYETDISTTSTTHTLSFYYTERGGGGSTCYMRYTLPSVITTSTEDNSGTLKVEKEVADPGDEYLSTQPATSATEATEATTESEPTYEDVEPDKLISKTIYVNTTAVNSDGSVYYAWVWDYDAETGKYDLNGHWEKLEKINSNYYSLTAHITESAPAKIIIARVNPDEENNLTSDTPWDDSAAHTIVWNRTYCGTGEDGNDIGFTISNDDTDNLIILTGYDEQNTYHMTYEMTEIDPTSSELADKKTVYIDTSNVDGDNAVFYAYVWNANATAGTSGTWVEMNKLNSDYYSLDVKYDFSFLVGRFNPKKVDSVDDARFNNDSETDGPMWNQSEDIGPITDADTNNLYVLSFADGKDKIQYTSEEIADDSNYLAPDVKVYFKVSSSDTSKNYFAWVWGEKNGESGHWEKLTDINTNYQSHTFRKGEKFIIVSSTSDSWSGDGKEWNNLESPETIKYETQYDGTTTFYDLSDENNTETNAENIPADDLTAGVVPSNYSVGIYEITGGSTLDVYDDYEKGVLKDSKEVGSSGSTYYILIRELKKDSLGSLWGRFDFYYELSGSDKEGMYNNVWVEIASYNSAENTVTDNSALTFKTNEGLCQTGSYTTTAGRTAYCYPNTFYKSVGTISSGTTVEVIDIDVCLDGSYSSYGAGGICWGKVKLSDDTYGWINIRSNFVSGGTTGTFTGDTLDSVKDWSTSDFSAPYAYTATADLPVYDNDGNPVTGDGSTVKSGYNIYIKKLKEDSCGNIWGGFDFYYHTEDQTGTESEVHTDVWVKLASQYSKTDYVDDPTYSNDYQIIPDIDTVYNCTSASDVPMRVGPYYYSNVASKAVIPAGTENIKILDIAVLYEQDSIEEISYWVKVNYNDEEGWVKFSSKTGCNFEKSKVGVPKLSDYPVGVYIINQDTDIFKSYTVKSVTDESGNTTDELVTTQFASNNSVTSGNYIYINRVKADKLGNIWGRFDYWYYTTGDGNGTAEYVNRDARIMLAKNNGEEAEPGVYATNIAGQSIPKTGFYKATDGVNLRFGPNYNGSACYGSNGAAASGDTVTVTDIAVRYQSSDIEWTLYVNTANTEGWASQNYFEYSGSSADAFPTGAYKLASDMTVYSDYKNLTQFSSNSTVKSGYNIYLEKIEADSDGNIWGRFDFWYSETGNTGTADSVNRNAWVQLVDYSNGTQNLQLCTDGDNIPLEGVYDYVGTDDSYKIRSGPHHEGYTDLNSSGVWIEIGDEVNVTDLAVRYDTQNTPSWWGYITKDNVSGWINLDTSYFTNEYSDVEPLFSGIDNAMMGLDLSYHIEKGNTGKVDFRMIKALGYDFVILRAGYLNVYNEDDPSSSTYVTDTKFYEFYVKAKLAGLKVGSYWYGYSYSDTDVADISTTEAEQYLKVLEGLKTYVKDYNTNNDTDIDVTFEMPLYYDYEELGTYALATSASEIKNITNAAVNFCNIMENNGYLCGVYSFTSWYNTCFNFDLFPADYPIWWARYPTALSTPTTYTDFNTTDYPKSYWLNDNVGLWQFACWGDPSTINSQADVDSGLDVDVCYVDYETFLREEGLNGFGTADEAETTPEATEPETQPTTQEVGDETAQPTTSPGAEDPSDDTEVVKSTTNFPFTVNFYSDEELENSLNGPFAYKKYTASGTLVGSAFIENGGTFYLKDGQYVVFEGLPYDAYYTVKEGDAVTGYSTNVSVTNSQQEGEVIDTAAGKSYSSQLASLGTDTVKFINSVSYNYRIRFNYKSRLDGDVYFISAGVLKDDELEDNLPKLSQKFIMNNAPYEDNFFNSITWNLDNFTTSYDETTRTATATVYSDTEVLTSNLTVLDVSNFSTDNSKALTFFDTINLKYGTLAKEVNKTNYTGTDKDDGTTNEGLLYTAPDTISYNLKDYVFDYWVVYDCKLSLGNDIVFDEENGLYVRPERADNFITKVYSKAYNYVAYDDYYIVPVYVPSDKTTSLATSGIATTISLLDYSRNQYTAKDGESTDKTGAVYDTVFADFALMYSKDDLLLNSDLVPEGESYQAEDVKTGLFLEVCGTLDQNDDGSYKTDITDYCDKVKEGTKYVTSDADISKMKKGIIAMTDAGKTSGGYAAENGDKRNILRYDIDKTKLNNKNRYEYYLGFVNNDNVRNKLIKAYSYIICMDSNGEEQITLSENPVVFLNYYDIGTKTYMLEEVTQ